MNLTIISVGLEVSNFVCETLDMFCNVLDSKYLLSVNVVIARVDVDIS